MVDKFSLQREKWKEIWWKARNNMPAKYGRSTIKEWSAIPVGTVPIAAFIEGRAKGKYRVVNGCVQEERISFSEYYIGAESLLLALIGYKTCMDKTTQVRAAIKIGRIPKDEKKRRILMELAGPKGNEIAWEYLRKKGTDHLYVNQTESVRVQRNRP